MKTFSNIDFLGYPVFNGSLDQLTFEDRLLVNTINQYSYCIAEKDEAFKLALTECDILLPDGVGITGASRLINGKPIKKIAGADIHAHLLEKLNKESGSCFYLGASEETLNKIMARISVEYPNIRVKSFSPPFKSKFNEQDSLEMVSAVNSFKPDVLFVGMTAPKQEKWAFEHKNNLDSGMICSIGAVFDFYAGTINRPNKIWIKMGLEWFGRLLREPRRMWKRYIYYGGIFTFYLIKKKIYLVFAAENV